MFVIIKRCSYFITLFIFFVGLFGCEADTLDKNFEDEKFVHPEASFAKERVDAENQFEQLLQSQHAVVTIKGDFSISDFRITGTGFFLQNNTIVSANHVGEDFATIQIKTDIRSEVILIPIQPVQRVQTEDVIFLKVEAPKRLKQFYDSLRFKSAKSVFSKFTQSGKASLKDILVGMKCMPGKDQKIFMGTLYSWEPTIKRINVSVNNNIEGCSGAPLFTSDGFVIGLVQSHKGVLVHALDIQEVLDLFAASSAKNTSLFKSPN